AGHHQLRQGTAGSGRARLARSGTCALPRRAGWSEGVMRALEAARAALAATEGEAEIVAHAESSGLARFAASEVHQPTLIDNVVVTLRLVRDGRTGVASTNRVDGDGLAELARRAAEAAESTPPDPDFPGLAEPAELPSVDG